MPGAWVPGMQGACSVGQSCWHHYGASVGMRRRGVVLRRAAGRGIEGLWGSGCLGCKWSGGALELLLFLSLLRRRRHYV